MALNLKKEERIVTLSVGLVRGLNILKCIVIFPSRGCSIHSFIYSFFQQTLTLN